MTFPRRMVVAAVFAGVALVLALVGAFAHWPDQIVGVFAGMGASFALLLVVMRLAPRWWREHCDEEYASRASREYRRRMLPAMLVYMAVVFASSWLLKHYVQPLPLRALIAISPALPIIFVMRAFLRYLRSIDEMQRRIEMEAIGVSALFVSQAYLVGGFLQIGKVIAVPADVAMIWVFPLMCLSYGIGKFIALRRYR